MFNEIKNVLEELYSYSEYLGMIKKDIPKILGIEEQKLVNILEDKIVPAHAAVRAIIVLHDIMEKDIENTVLENFLDLYGKEDE